MWLRPSLSSCLEDFTNSPETPSPLLSPSLNGLEIYAQRQPPRHDPKTRLSVHIPAVHLAKAEYSSAVIGLVTS